MPPFHPPRRTPTIQPVAPSAPDRNDVLVDHVDELLVEILDVALPLVWRAACFVDLSDHLEAERAKGRQVFWIGGQLTHEPELLALDLIGLPRPACARGAARAAARRAIGN